MQYRTGRRRAASAILSGALLCATLQVATAPPAAAAVTIHVPADYDTVGAALDAAVDGDTIVVAPGTYEEELDFEGKDVALVSSGGPEVTTLTGAGAHRVFIVGPGGRVEGFTITGSTTTETTPTGQVLIGDAVVTGNRFVGNAHQGLDWAGALSIAHTNDGQGIVTNNVFTGNTCSQASKGGVVQVEGLAHPLIANNLFVENPCPVDLRVRQSSSPLIVNNTFVGGGSGVGIAIAVNSDAGEQVRNNIITEQSIGILNESAAPHGIDHNLLGGNQFDYFGFASQTGSNGNLGGVPHFIDRLGRDFRLADTSPGIDAGSTTGAPADDFGGTTRPVDGPDVDLDAEFDIGAFERDGTEPPPVRQTGVPDMTWSGDAVSTMQTKYQVALGPTTPDRLAAGVYKEGDGQGRMRIWSYNSAGGPDSAWGSIGYVLRTFAPTAGVSFPYEVDQYGSRRVIFGSFNGSTARLGVAQLNSTGGYHNPFSGDGRATYKVFKYEHDLLEPFRAQMLTGGKMGIAVAAWDYDSTGQLVYVGQAAMRLNAVGSLDTTFSGDGILPLAKDIGDVQFLPDGSVYMDRQAGTSHEVRRYRVNGTLDTAFSGDGKALAACGAHRGAYLQPDPQNRPLLMCVREVGGTLDLRLVRFTTSGALDPTYSGNGMASLVLTGGTDENWTVHMDPQGRAWAASPQSSDRKKVIVQSLDASGEPNAAFSGDGRTVFSWTAERGLAGMAVSGNRLFVNGFREPYWFDVYALTI